MREKEDIPDAFWQECTELVLKQLERKKTLDKTKDSDLLFVLEHLNRLSLVDEEYMRHATLLEEIMQYNVPESSPINSTLEKRDYWEDLDNIDLDRFELESEDKVGLSSDWTIPECWDDEPVPATTEKKGRPTEEKMDEDPYVTVDYSVAFLGSDKDDSNMFGQQIRPGNILEPAIKEFQRLAAAHERTQGEVPIHMASHMRDKKVGYGESAPGWNISNENIRMVLDIIKQQAIVLLLHPNLHGCFSTSDELKILELNGYQKVEAFCKVNISTIMVLMIPFYTNYQITI